MAKIVCVVGGWKNHINMWLKYFLLLDIERIQHSAKIVFFVRGWKNHFNMLLK